MARPRRTPHRAMHTLASFRSFALSRRPGFESGTAFPRRSPSNRSANSALCTRAYGHLTAWAALPGRHCGFPVSVVSFFRFSPTVCARSSIG